MTEPNESSALVELRDDASSRKSFLRLAGAGAASSLALLLAACGDDDETSSGTTPAETESTTTEAEAAGGDLDILNYALTLEFLETDFYTQVVEAGIIKDKNVASLAQALQETEQAHVDALIKTIESLGGTAVEAPATKFEPVLEQGLETVLMTAATVENLGAAAYLGQAPKIKNKEILAAALAIHSVEARHAAGLNMLVGRGFTGANALEGSIPDGPFAAAMDMDAVLAAVKPYLA